MPGQPSAPHRRYVDPVPWSAVASRDRLSSTAFIAALLHGMLILGVTFSAADARNDRAADSSLEVVLVTAPPTDRAAPADAVLLAQTNLVGRGNAEATASLSTAPGAAFAADTVALPRPGADRETRDGSPDPEQRAPVVEAVQANAPKAPAPGESDQSIRARAALPLTSRSTELLGRLAPVVRIPDRDPRELVISANTREARIAGYLILWKRKVEQTGTLNYPVEARRTGSGYPVLEVAIAADGSLREVVVRSSSGQQGLDQAAVQILKLAAPFAPFPDNLRDDYDVLRFAYEWRFSAGSGSLRAAGA